MTRDGLTSHPLTADEIELYTRCAHTWCGDGFGWDSVKTDALSDQLKQRLECLAKIADVTITFICEDSEMAPRQHYIRATKKWR